LKSRKHPDGPLLVIGGIQKAARWLVQKHLYMKAFSPDPSPVRPPFDLPDPLFREVKTRAVQQGVKLKDLVASFGE